MGKTKKRRQMNKVSELASSLTKNRLARIIIALLEDKYKSDVIDTDEEHNLIGKDNEFASKDDWIENEVWDYLERTKLQRNKRE